MLSVTDPEFVRLIDGMTMAICFMDGWQLAMAHRTPQPVEQAYEPSESSAASARQRVGAVGVSVPGPRSRKLTAYERSQLEAKQRAAQVGFEGGRFTGIRGAA